MFRMLCFLFGHKGKLKCKFCGSTFGFPKYPNPPNIPKKNYSFFGAGGGGGGGGF